MMKYDYLITATGDNDRDSVINAMLKYAKMDNVSVRSHKSFDSFLQELPAEPIPGLATASCEWLRLWGIGGGDMSTEDCGKAACNTDNPRELAQAIYDGIANYSKIPFEASSLVMAVISEVISEIQNSDSGDNSSDND